MNPPISQLTLLILLVWASSASGQSPPQWRAVDQAVADLDPLSRSFRQAEAGLRITGEQTSLFERVDPVAGPLSYYRLGPGFRARTPRLEYLYRRGNGLSRQVPGRDGRFIEIIGPDTVFELGSSPVPSLSPGPPPWPSGQVRPTMVDRHVELRVDTRLDTRLTPTVGLSDAGTPAP